MTDLPVYKSQQNAPQGFNQGILLLSIAKAFAHDPSKGEKHAWDITQTVIGRLFLNTHTQLTTRTIAEATHQVLDRFDHTAAAQYALSHQLMISLRRRGRPSFGDAASFSSPSPEKQV